MSHSRKNSMAFHTLPCLKCRTPRVLGGDCDECGKKGPPGEVNSAVVDRRTVVARIDAALTSPSQKEGKLEENTNLPSKTDLRNFVEVFAEALNNILKEPKSSAAATSMIQQLYSLESMRNRCQSLPKLRPNVALHRSLSSTIDALYLLWPTYSQALCAPTMHVAKSFAKRGQELLDSATATLLAYEELVDSTSAYEDLTIQDYSERLLTAVSLTYPTLSIIEIGQQGKSLAEIEMLVPTDEAHGIEYIVLQTIASVHMDLDRINEVLKKTAQLCLANERLQEIALEKDSLESLATSQRLLYESLASFEAVLVREADEKAVIRRVIKFYAEVYEDVVSPILAWYTRLSGSKQKSYSKLLQDDATILARNLCAHPSTASFLENDGTYLRNAAQHGNSFSIDQDQVRFTLRSYRETVSTSEIINDVLSLFESISAMSWSLSNALSQAGYPILLQDEDATYMKLSAFHMAKFHLKHSGTPAITSEEGDSSWSFTLSPGQHDVFGVAVALALNSPDYIRKATVQTVPEATPLIISLEDYDRVSLLSGPNTQPLDRMMAVIELRNASNKEGRTLLKSSDLKYAAGSFALLLIMQKDLSVIPHLRRIRTLADLHNNQRAKKLITEAFRLYRNPHEIMSSHTEAKIRAWIEHNYAPSMPVSAAVLVNK